MDIPFASAITIGTILVTVGGSWFVVKWRLDRNERDRQEDRIADRKENDEQWAVITKIRERIHNHERESSAVRLDIEKQFGQVNVKLADTNGKFEAIMGSLDEIRKQIDRMRDKT